MDIWNLNLRHLRAVAQIAHLGTTHAAAAAVSLTQSAISQALARLEQVIGTPLFDRSRDGMVATAAADLLVPRIQAALDHIGSAHVTMSRLHAVLALADGGSYAKASALTGLPEASLHRAVNDLAILLRRPLVERRGRVVALTKYGEQLARAFRLAKVELEAGLSEVEALTGHETRRIAIGAMPLSRARVLPRAVSHFLRRHPLVRVSIGEGSRAELVEPLRNGAIDLMIGALREPLLEPDLVQAPLFHDEPAVIGRAGHPLAGIDPHPADLAAYPWIISAPGTPLRGAWERMFGAAGLPLPATPVEAGSVMIIRNLLMDGDFLTLLSPDQIMAETEAGWLAVIARPRGLGRTIGITTRASWRPTRVQAEFLDGLRDVAAGLATETV
ncbi:LysR family transcriptional regulator [Nitrospirillum iridis]|nr:LysR family transcriptional regulator [Nitrospirillum iridis]